MLSWRLTLSKLDDVRRCLLHKLFDEGRSEGCGAPSYVLHGRQVRRLHFGVRGQEADQRGHQVQPGGLVLLQRQHVGLRLELGQGDDLGAQVHGQCHDGVHGVDVEEGEDGHGALLLRRAFRPQQHENVRVEALADVGHHVVVGEGHALGRTRRTGGVGQHDDLVVHVSLGVLKGTDIVLIEI